MPKRIKLNGGALCYHQDRGLYVHIKGGRKNGPCYS